MQTEVLDPPVATQEQTITADELLVLSQQDENRYELIQGIVVMMSPAGSIHGDLALNLGARIRIYVEDHHLGRSFAAETGFLLDTAPDTVRAPDVSFVRTERLPAEGLPQSYFPGAPDLVVEVVSPNDRASDVQEKVQDWLHHGTLLVWVVEPASQTVIVYRADGSATVLQKGDELHGEDVLPGFSYSLDRLFV